MIQRRRYHFSQISLRLMALRTNVCQFKQDELSIQQALSGRPTPGGGQALDDAFDQIQDSINHTHELLEALAQVTGDAEVVGTSARRGEQQQTAERRA